MNLKTATIIALATGLSVSVIMNIHQHQKNAKIWNARLVYFRKSNAFILELLEFALTLTSNPDDAAKLFARIEEIKNANNSVK